MIVGLIAAMVCGEDLVIEEVASASARVELEWRVTLVQGVRFDGALESIGRFAGVLRWEPSGAVEARVGARLTGVAGSEDGASQAYAEPRLHLGWRGDTTEAALGWSDGLRWSTLVDPLPADLRLGQLPPTEIADRRRAIPFVWARHTIDRLSFEVLWQPLWVQAAGVDADVDARALEDGAVGARVGWRAGTAGLSVSWLWRRATVTPFQRQHSLGFDGDLTTGVVRWRIEGAWHSERSEWVVDRAAHGGGAIEGLLSVGAAPTIFLDGELGLRTSTSPSALALWLRLTLLMAFDGVVRLDAEAHVRLDRDAQQLSAAVVWRAAAWVEVALGITLDEGRAALYDARDQVWARLVLDL